MEEGVHCKTQEEWNFVCDILGSTWSFSNREGWFNNYKEDKSPFDILINKKDMPPFQCKKIDDLRKEILYLNKMSLGSAIQKYC